MSLPIITREMRRQLERDNAKQPEALVQVAREAWPANYRPPGIAEVWRSRGFLVQVYEPVHGAERLSVLRTTVDAAQERWKDGITWDELQRLKRECGRGARWAVEIYPEDAEVVNVGNLRHLWVLPEAPPFAWRAGQPHAERNVLE